MNSKQIGKVTKLVRYPVKSMAGIEMERADLGWHGLAGDRRYAVRLIDNDNGFPWLAASKMPELLLYRPCDFDAASSELLPTRVQNPSGESLKIAGDELRAEISETIGSNVELMALKHGIFDDSPVSVISTSTVSQVCNEANVTDDTRRFRANIVVEFTDGLPFAEDDFVGHVIAFGEGLNAPAVYVTKRDERCRMIGIDPDTAEHNTAVVKAAVNLNENNAGVYCAVVRTGAINIGASIYLSDG